MDQVPVVRAEGLGHVLDQVSPTRHVDHLGAPTDGEEGDPVLDGHPGQGEVEGVLGLVHVVLGRVVVLSRPARGEVSPARQQDAVGHPDPVADQGVEVVVGDPVGDLRVHDERLGAGVVHRLDELGGRHLGSVAQGRSALGEPRRDDHDGPGARWPAGTGSLGSHAGAQCVLLRSGLRMPRNSQSPPLAVERTSSLSVGWAPTSVRMGVGPSTMWLRSVPRPSTSTSTTSPG